MLARDLVQLAALVTEKGPVLVAGPAEIEPRRVAQYWSASKCRQDRWTRALKTFKFVAAKSGPPDATAGLPQTLIEILTGETLTRAWTAVLCAYDRRRRVQEAEPVARGIFSGHLEARNRALHLLLDGRGLTLSQAVQIDRLRRRSERWSDLLVARLIELADVSELAPDPVRARRLAVEAREGTALTGPAAFWPAVVASVTAASREIPAEPTPNLDLNAEIAASIVGCFPPGMFDGAGVMTSLRFARMSAAADDTQGMIESLLRDERADESAGRPGPMHRAEKFKRRF